MAIYTRYLSFFLRYNAYHCKQQAGQGQTGQAKELESIRQALSDEHIAMRMMQKEQCSLPQQQALEITAGTEMRGKGHGHGKGGWVP